MKIILSSLCEYFGNSAPKEVNLVPPQLFGFVVLRELFQVVLQGYKVAPTVWFSILLLDVDQSAYTKWNKICGFCHCTAIITMN